MQVQTGCVFIYTKRLPATKFHNRCIPHFTHSVAQQHQALQHSPSPEPPYPPASKPTHQSRPELGPYTTITKRMSKTRGTLIPLNPIPMPNIPPLHPPKNTLKRRTKHHHRRKPTTRPRTTRQLLPRKSRILESRTGMSVEDTGTPTPETTRPGVIATGTQTVCEFALFEGRERGMRDDLLALLFGGAAWDGGHGGLGLVLGVADWVLRMGLVGVYTADGHCWRAVRRVRVLRGWRRRSL
jgi:hypothetical protein